jgi:hypothetical protein
MYELLLLFFFAIIILFAYLFGCEMISFNTINSIPIFYHHNNKTIQENLLLKVGNFIRLVFMGLRDSESGYFARLSARISSAPILEKSKAHKSLLTSKISRCLIILALVLPIKVFIVFIFVLITISLFNERKISVQLIGIILGYILLKYCIELSLDLSNSSYIKELMFESFPGYLYYEFSMKHPSMFLINGVIFPFIILNASSLFPFILVLSVVMKIPLLHFLFAIAGVFAGLAFRHYNFARTTRGLYSAIEKENITFYILDMLFIFLTIIIFYLYYPSALNLVMNRSNLADGALLILVITILSIATMQALKTRDLGQEWINKIFLKDRKIKIRYKYSKSLFKQTFIGMKILMNELRTYSIEQGISCKNMIETLKIMPLNIDAVALNQQKFQNYAEELSDYLKISLQSEDMSSYEDDLILCANFLENAKKLEENCFKKFKILKAAYEDIDIQKFNLLFSPIIKSEDTFFDAYKTALQSLAKNDIEELSTIIANESIKIQEINEMLNSYFSAEKETISENQKTLLLDLIQHCQVAQWLIGQQGEILNKWYTLTLDTPYILGH